MSISPAAAAAYAKFVQFVEPLTRFDAASVRLVSGATETVGIAVRQTDSISYEVTYQDGAGKVPDNVHSASDAGTLNTLLDDWRRREQAQLAGRLHGWLAREGRTIGNRLAVQDCFDGPHAGGYAIACELCKGKGTADCGTCKGDGKTKCPGCNDGLTQTRSSPGNPALFRLSMARAFDLLNNMSYKNRDDAPCYVSRAFVSYR